MDPYLELLSEKFPTTEAVLTEIINLEAILQLPKGTELFLSDIHGEFPAFDHILRIGSGNLKEKVRELFENQLSEEERNQLTLFVAYPEYVQRTAWYAQQEKEQLVVQLIDLLGFTSVKYTRSKVRKSLPKEYSYIIEELLYLDNRLQGKKAYAQKVIEQLVRLGEVDRFLEKLALTIQTLVIDHLHIVGDIFDRGTQAAKVMDRLMTQSSIDIQWGNHDILWLGAFYGSKACLLTLLRIATRYNYLFELEKEYAINLRPLFSFAHQTYKKNAVFTPKNSETMTDSEQSELEQVHQALAIMQFKVEEQLLMRRSEFEMDERQLLHKIDYEKEIITLEGASYSIKGACFQTISPETPEQLTKEEEQIIDSLMYSFQHSLRMKNHMEFLLEKGAMYLVYNDHLLFHGCIPVDEKGNFLALEQEQVVGGVELLTFFEEKIRESAKTPDSGEDLATDYIWYAWSGRVSPLFGKSKMATFERYFLEETQTHVEKSNAYYRLRNELWFSQKVLSSFGIKSTGSVIINGHTPVKVCKGESPVKAEGTVFVIDGGLSKAYQKTTGIAGYSLLLNSYGFQLVTHYPFVSIEQQLAQTDEGTYVKKVIDQQLPRRLNRTTTKGRVLQREINHLHQLLEIYPTR
ncbi:fructose-1,6-bisphosphatase [Enterococcus thailandicus]|uniref:fructose-1,6-bisphosphatase n=1 Tax=Enterococcus TaxID=1350 RepID=UPI001C4C28E6|nr:fructose-1,6-bisphosphatase [Enterococcus thailandicus]